MVGVMRGDVIGGQVPRIRDRMDAATWLADRAFGKAVAQVETKSLNVDMGLSNISTEELLDVLLSKDRIQVLYQTCNNLLGNPI